ncbi:prephenate dehydrogenase [Actinoplanes teichomyceticus]|uniref:Prephenate dehydrogenase n=1 Tax=Actinoplanes teichomyceticus TaxID=1867 RepID=Q6ZZG9_ACTTI|nr:prephenate dehydrogenase [Actinoplanes teichomyceticus]TWG09454.1 prephenate dehydrogenase [Actinoplanes teichomyceticus]GIF17143.1 prephenate dehydrogenase [Actinoplanes teichomyceticus]CAG15036.1 prephenate dehydrogenase [Actinoplanes teichomyceticus]
MRTLLVIGTGLIGTSVALAARRAGVAVFLADRDVAAARVAEALGAGLAEPPRRPVDLALVAVPPAQVGPVLRDAQANRAAHSYTDVAGVKGQPERDVLRLASDPASYVGGHPMAGRERSGPLAATADLFAGKTWVLTPNERTGAAALERATTLAEICGAAPVRLDSRAHDTVVALTSHVPHLMASLTAARLLHGPAATEALVGQGVRDVTRIAAGDPALWTDIVRSNAPAVAAVLRGVRDDLTRLLAATDILAGHHPGGRAQAEHTVTDLLERGVAGAARTRPPAGAPEGFAVLRVVLDGRPGSLARLLEAVAAHGGSARRAGAAPGPDAALAVDVELPAAGADAAAAALAAAGWAVSRPGLASAARRGPHR